MMRKKNSKIFLCVLSVATVLMLLIPLFPAAADSSAGWGLAELIETDNAGDARYVEVAVDSSGNAMAVWRQTDGIRYNIWANHYVVGTGWGTATLIENDNIGSAFYPKVAIDDSGNAIAVWYQEDGMRTNIWANRYVVGFGWGTATLIETDDFGFALYPEVAVDGSGNAIVVWHQDDGSRYNIWANHFVIGLGWSTATLIETDNAGNALQPEVAIDSSGNAIAVWYQDDGTRYNILANRYVVGTGWGIATLIETDNTGEAYYPQVAFDASGNAIAVWHQDDGTRYNVWANRYVVGTGWGTPTLIETENTDAYPPQIAVCSSGTATAVWYQDDGTHLSIWANRYIIGTGWNTASLIETDDAGDARYPEVAVDDNGNAIAVWRQDDGTLLNIWVNHYIEGTGWGTATLLETENAGSAYYPKVVVDGNGNAIAVWYQDDGMRTNIWANRYVMPDTTPPYISLTNPIDDTITDIPTITVSGTTEPGVHLVVNGIVVDVASDGTFEFLLALSEGENLITAKATDASDNSATDTLTVTYVNPAPVLEQELQETKDDLNATKDNLTETKNALETTQAELDDTKEALETTQTELDETTDNLTETKTALGNTQTELDDTKIALDSTQAELEDTKDDLADAKEKLESQEMLILLAPILVLVILVILLVAMYQSLTKKISKGLPASGPAEESSPSKSEEILEKLEEENQKEIPPSEKS